MSKTTTSDNSSRSPQRKLLAELIRIRDDAAAEDREIADAAKRATDDLRRARRAVEDATRELKTTRERAARELTMAYVGGAEANGAALAETEAEAALAHAQRRLADITLIEQELASHGRSLGWSVPSSNVETAVKEVVKASPVVRRLASDYRALQASFQELHSTLRLLAGKGMIPDDLRGVTPSASATYFAPPDPRWQAAIEALSRDPDAELPS